MQGKGGLPNKVGMGMEPLSWTIKRADEMHRGPRGRQGPQHLSSRPLLDLQGKVVLWVGGGWELGKVQLGVFITGWDFYHWVGFKVCGGSGHPLPARHFFFFALVLATLAFSRGSISTYRPSWLARRGHDSTTHPQQRQPGPRLPVPLWAGLLEENSTQAFFKTGNCSPCFLEDRNCPHGNCGTKRPH